LLRQHDTRCPSCDATIGERTVSVRPRFAMMIVGLALTGCPGDDGGDTAGDEGATAPTASSTMGATETASTDGDDGSTLTTGVEPLYGEPATTDAQTTTGASGTGSESGSESGTGDSGGGGPTTGPSPLYGVAET
jgi:hypothetical protein